MDHVMSNREVVKSINLHLWVGVCTHSYHISYGTGKVCIPAVDHNGSVARAHLPLLDLANQVNHGRGTIRNSFFRPSCGLELPDWLGRAVLRGGDGM